MENDPDQLEVWCTGEEWCPVTTTANLIGQKWHPVIVYQLLEQGPTGFTELKEHVDGISNKVLSNSLDDLEEKQLVERAAVSDEPFRVQYSMTTHGASLEPVITAMHDWGERYLTEPESSDSSGV